MFRCLMILHISACIHIGTTDVATTTQELWPRKHFYGFFNK